MGMNRMFHVSCDKCYTQVDGDEWYASLAKQRAKEEGYVYRNKQWLCPDCAANL